MEKHIPTEHIADDMSRPCEPMLPPTAAQNLMNKMKENRDEEEFRAQNADFDKGMPRYRGICASLGNPVFSNTPADPLSYQKPLITYGLKGYQRPIQHPLYTTTSSELGLQPKPGIPPEKYFPRNNSFTNSERHANYQDTHFTTEMDKGSSSG